jgi:hypothetical protein
MKSRELLTIPVLIVTNYRIVPAEGKYLHSFTPETTETTYFFLGGKEPLFEEGERYSVGFRSHLGQNWVEPAATAKAGDVDKNQSLYIARVLGEEHREVEVSKSKSRVVHAPITGLYLGKKYAWRIHGMAVARDTFDAYLKEINHPSIACVTDGSRSIAYRDIGLTEAMSALIDTAVWISGNRFRSPLLPSKDWFQIKGISAITDKK